ncbi:hypothetical protein JOF35_008805 [Streptomyces demainii]|uniref:Uncharacterized protein n=1 Tax=Streptomyces demainii TaxID=588122 RepID=A0ABT9L9J9_9ACTN|nr:hypothetical protein [Streptomyces demainii]MDP9616361.1 hypothetical protein [Streptomyces demainii]MDP9616447.1 hypothetical protein [Streptomyces demainii]
MFATSKDSRILVPLSARLSLTSLRFEEWRLELMRPFLLVAPEPLEGDSDIVDNETHVSILGHCDSDVRVAASREQTQASIPELNTNLFPGRFLG